MAKEIREKQEENGSQSAKSDRGVHLLEQEERQFQDALEDDEVREALKLLHARDKERLRKKQDENSSKSAKTDRGALLLEQEEERRFQDALEDDEVREALKLHARDKTA